GHALGIWHEQSRPERDDYIKVFKHNIKHKYQDQFTKQHRWKVDDFGIPYDYGSVMHYGGLDFSRNDRPTITTNDRNFQATIGQREEPSFADVKQINEAYCKGTGPPLDCKNGGYQGPKDCDVCRCPTGLGGTLCDQV
ncbi:hypothetical protein PMAYCL1PPCAC_27708, partial [Pristionchus mayeri]